MGAQSYAMLLQTICKIAVLKFAKFKLNFTNNWFSRFNYLFSSGPSLPLQSTQVCLTPKNQSGIFAAFIKYSAAAQNTRHFAGHCQRVLSVLLCATTELTNVRLHWICM